MLPLTMPMDQIELKGQAGSEGDLLRYEDITFIKFSIVLKKFVLEISSTVSLSIKYLILCFTFYNFPSIEFILTNLCLARSFWDASCEDISESSDTTVSTNSTCCKFDTCWLQGAGLKKCLSEVTGKNPSAWRSSPEVSQVIGW